MSNMNRKDIPVLRSAGAAASSSGYSWFLTDKSGEIWQVIMEDDGMDVLIFREPSGASVRMSRQRFDELFFGV